MNEAGEVRGCGEEWKREEERVLLRQRDDCGRGGCNAAGAESMFFAL